MLRDMPRLYDFARGVAIVFVMAASGCTKQSQPAPRAQVATAPSALDIVLTPLDGTSKEDREIARLQEQIKERPEAPQLLEQLGWAFVSKARLTSDPGFYKLAEQCSAAMEVGAPGDPDAALLRGHVLHALHRFKEAEAVARDLTSRREFVFDYALLGDALMEQGELGAAIEAYQKMVDLKPCLQTYSRIAHLRWLKGDLAGAVDAARIAVRAGSPREAEPLAWACTRLAAYLLQEGDLAAAQATTDQAMELIADYAPALLMRGKLLLANEQFAEAAAVIEQAAQRCPLPDYLWTYAEALRGAGEIEKLQSVETRLRETGPANDPRTYSLFLATTGGDAARALELAQAELDARQDVFTHDALAWALYRSGDIAAARTERDRALSEGTQDARLFLHAGIIAAAAGETAQAADWLGKAEQNHAALLPTERAELTRGIASLNAGANRISAK